MVAAKNPETPPPPPKKKTADLSMYDLYDVVLVFLLFFKHISHLFLVLLSLTLNKQMLAGPALYFNATNETEKL